MSNLADSKPTAGAAGPSAGKCGKCAGFCLFLVGGASRKAENVHTIVNNEIDNFADNSGTIKAVD
jgi:hypothetical protein